MVNSTQVKDSLQALQVAYELGVEDEQKALLEALQEEEKSLKRYGRTDLWGVHVAIRLIERRMKK